MSHRFQIQLVVWFLFALLILWLVQSASGAGEDVTLTGRITAGGYEVTIHNASGLPVVAHVVVGGTGLAAAAAAPADFITVPAGADVVLTYAVQRCGTSTRVWATLVRGEGWADEPNSFLLPTAQCQLWLPLITGGPPQ